ncbi:MAG: hypothetical protein WED04_06500 [Promethearchaeati archaeon SRVP18_Atabeyarchaeia-1]
MGVEIYYKIKYDPKFRPLRGEQVKISKSDRNRYVLANDKTEETYYIDSSAALIWKMMDGHHSISSIKRKLGNRHSPDDVEGFITFAAQENLIRDVNSQNGEGEMVKDAKKGTLKPEVVSPLIINMPLLGASKSSSIFRRLYRLTRVFFTKIFLFIAIIVVAFTAFLLRDVFLNTLSSGSFNVQGSTILGFFIFSIVLIFPILVVHELAHGLALTHFGASPGELGTGLYYFYPMFYCDTSESWRLSRGKRVLVSIVGPLSTLLIGSVAGLAAFFNLFPSASYLLVMTFFFAYYMALLNMAPMFETDGYYALMDILNIPNLRSEAFGYIRTLLTKGRRQARMKYSEYSRRQRFAMVTYGGISIGWSVVAIYLSYLFFIYIVRDALTQLTNLITAVATITGFIGTDIEGTLISIGVAVGSLGLLTFISLRLYAMTYLPLKSVATRIQKVGGKSLSVDGMYLSAFFLVPVMFNPLRKKIMKTFGKCSKRISQDYSVKEEGELVTIKLALNRGATKTFTQLRAEAIRYENTLRNNYNLYLKDLIKTMRKDRTVGELSMIDRDNSAKAASLLKRNEFLKAFNERIEKVYSNIGQLLGSFVCFIWSVDLRPDQFSELNPKDFEYSFLEDISTSTGIYEVGTFRKERVIGSKNLEYMLKGMGEYFNSVKENPRIMQTTHATVLFEPIKNRLMIFGRAKRVSELREVVEHIFLIPTRSTFEATTAQDLSTSLLRLSQFMERSPTFNADNIMGTEYKELKFMRSVLDKFSRSLDILRENIEAMQSLTETVYLKAKEAEKEIRSLDYDVALLDLVIKATKYESDSFDSSTTLYSSLARQNHRLMDKVEKIRRIVAEALHKNEAAYSKNLRKMALASIIALIFSVFLTVYLHSMLSGLGAWNLILLAPIAIISSISLLSFLGAMKINSKAHSPIIDSLLLLSNHYYSLASTMPSINYLLNKIK